MAQSGIIQVFNLNRERISFLQNAFDIGYHKTLNSLWTASFSLPSDDPKNQHCKPFNYVELYDGKERVELFRIIGEDLARSSQAVTVYTCEHVLSTLMDDVLFAYHQIGNIGVFTPTVIRYILDRQTTRDWQLGKCEINRQFEYKFENNNLLEALFSVAKPFLERFIWDWDTTGYPWTLNLRLLSDDIKSELRYGKNIASISKVTDATSIITRLYCLGYGEGSNQLNICAVNGGLPYLDASTMSTWGMKASILVDRRFEDAESLRAYGLQILNSACDPYVSYSAEAVDLYKLTGQQYDKFNVGDTIRIIDEADGINEIFPIVEIEKSDLTGNPGAVSVTIANKSRDLSGSIAELQNRVLVNDLYSQGATNQVLVHFADNADLNNPALLKLYIPDSMVRVNSCVLNFEFEPFRAYQRGVESTQQNVYTTSSTNTSVSSSSQESTQTQTTSSTSTESPTTSSSSSQTPTTSSSATQSPTTSTSAQQTPTTSTSAQQTPTTSSGGASTATSSAVALLPQHMQDHGGYANAANHNHGVAQGTDFITGIDFKNQRVTSTMGFVASGAHTHGEHSHSVNIPNHSHTVTIPGHNHSVSIPGHSHSVSIPSHSHTVTIPGHSHTVTIPSHSHTVMIPGHGHTVNIPGHSHSVTVPAHTHAVEYGIFKTGGVNAGRLFINGRYVQDVSPAVNYNIANLLADSKGKIARNTFHRIEIYPIAVSGNAQALTRIVANVFLQIFTNSRGSGDF